MNIKPFAMLFYTTTVPGQLTKLHESSRGQHSHASIVRSASELGSVSESNSSEMSSSSA